MNRESRSMPVVPDAGLLSRGQVGARRVDSGIPTSPTVALAMRTVLAKLLPTMLHVRSAAVDPPSALNRNIHELAWPMQGREAQCCHAATLEQRRALSSRDSCRRRARGL